ncbi:hypothetical protein P879_11192 [Paragonimus westermani]|uniref:Glycosyl transferase 64 domain-containing protein n=1 Tax=Paragonimus westermani TaxID=34504 RepID=A0A8T0D706_9TREM|nr:hypothetical protein P879_11192 [Paragonimus westermani]
MGRSGSNTLCLVLLGSMKAVLEFRSVTDVFRNARDNVLVAAPYFPPHEYRPRLHIISPLLGFIDIFRGIPDKSATSSAVKRTNMLVFSAFRQFTPSPSSSVGEEDQYLFGKFKHNMEDSVGSWLLQLHSYDNPTAYEDCWSYPQLSQIYDDNSSESYWFPCSHTPKLLRSSTFGLVLSTNRLTPDDSGPAVFSWQLQLLFCLQAGTVPVVVGEGPFPYPKAISADTWEQAIIRINLRHTEQLIRQMNAISLAQLARLRYNGELIFQRHFRDDDTHLSTLLLEVSRRYGFTQPIAPSWSTMLVKELYSQNVTHQMFSQNRTQDLDCQLNGERRVCSVDLLPRQIAMGSSDSLKMNPFWTYPSTPWDTISDEVNKNHISVPNIQGTNKSSNANLLTDGQFTVVMLYYNRWDVLLDSIKALKSVAHLHSVIIVWNHPVGPSPEVILPKMPFPMKIFKAHNNSLNNRFLPLDLIQTEAILSLDDDVTLTVSEIEKGFR